MTKQLQAFIRILLLRISFTLFLAVTAWIHPAIAISAFAEPPLETAQFINYEKHRASSIGNNQPQITPNTNAVRVGIKKPIAQATNSVYGGRHYSKTEVIQLIENYSREYRIKSETPLCIARLESGFNPTARNSTSSASGVFQYLSSTWKATDEGKGGRSVFEADANIKAAIKYMASRGNAKP